MEFGGILGWIVTSLSLLGAYLNLKHNKYGFVLWVVSDFFWSAYDLGIGEYSQAFLFFLYAVFAAWGFMAWHKVNAPQKMPT